MTGNSQLVREVTDVSVSYLESNPPIMVVHAAGNVATSGWTNPGLSRMVYITPPADGIQEYDFMATPPGGIVPEVITPVAGKDEWRDPPTWIKGVRVKAATNSVEEAALLTNI